MDAHFSNEERCEVGLQIVDDARARSWQSEAAQQENEQEHVREQRREVHNLYAWKRSDRSPSRSRNSQPDDKQNASSFVSHFIEH